MVTRRQAIAAGATLLVSPYARPQPRSRILKVGLLNGGADSEDTQANLAGMAQRLAGLGYVEGRSITWERRFAGGEYSRLPALAEELIRMRPDLILVSGGTATDVMRQATSTIPLVMIVAADPLKSGWVKSLARPGGNLTGITQTSGDAGLKRAELLLEIAPQTRRIGVFMNPDNPTFRTAAPTTSGPVEAFARARNTELLRFELSSASDIVPTFTEMAARGVGALIVPPDSFFAKQHARIATLALERHWPSVGGLLSYATRGGLAAHGANYPELYRQAAVYIDKIARGAKPGDIPIAQADIQEVWINRRTAGALSLVIPEVVLLRATRVVD